MTGVKVYIWNARVGNSEWSAALAADVGHVSMSLGNTYISHRPMPEGDSDDFKVEQFNVIEKLFQLSESVSEISDYTKKYVGLAATRSTTSLGYRDDYISESRRKGREADLIYKIYGLKIDKILSKHLERASTLKYHPVTENCSKVVAETLLASFDEMTASVLKDEAVLRPGASQGFKLGLKHIPQLLINPKFLSLSWYGMLALIIASSWLLAETPTGLWMENVWTPNRVALLLEKLEQTLSGFKRTQSIFGFFSEELFSEVEEYDVKVVRTASSRD